MVRGSVDRRGREEAGAAMPEALPSAFQRLMLAMLGLGVLVGLLFPPFVYLVLGTERALSPPFWMACVGAGLVVGGANYLLFWLVVRRAVGRLAEAMEGVVDRVGAAADGQGMCDDDCRLEITSSDALGQVERSFNQMAEAVAHRVSVDGAVRDLLGTLAHRLDVADIGETLLRIAGETCDALAGALYAEEGEELALVSSFGIDDAGDLPASLERSHGLARDVARRKTLQVVSGDSLRWMTSSTPLGGFRPAGLVLLPLLSEGRTVGLIILALRKELPGPRATETLEALGAHGGAQLNNGLLHQKIEELAALDELTRLLNRRFGLRRLEEEFSRSLRHGVPLSVVLLDVDHFKRFNDTYGHDAGDLVLRRVARVMEASLRAADVVARYGGEEFMLVLPGTGQRDAVVVAERIRRTVETTRLPLGDQHLGVAVSLGIATWPILGCSTPSELITAADEALYHAKASGRNTVAVQRDGGPVLAGEADCGDEVDRGGEA